MTKKITFVFPEAVQIIDIKYYWKNEKGMTKSLFFCDGKDVSDGAEVNVYLPVTVQREEP